MLMSIAALLLAPSVADLACIMDRVAADERRAAFEEALGGRRGAMREKVAGLAADCGRERGWPADQVKEREFAALLEIVLGPALERLQRGKVSEAVIRKWFAAQTAEVRADPGSHPKAMESLIEALAAAGAKDADIEASAEPIGIFLGLLSGAERLGYVLSR